MSTEPTNDDSIDDAAPGDGAPVSRRARRADGDAGPASAGRRPRRRSRRSPVIVGVWEALLEVVFLGLVCLVSWLVYDELRWPFIAAVFLAVNAVLLVLALVAWLRRRGRRADGADRP